ncbi:MAG TPA: hypothetical protein VGN18_03615 [Jatrophihabitans sp.]|jgi:hypothetical protein|uniref:hypothetical protein n=1 Tax=Jatrophihabitans sp. TaxID=1932789 RepID=UPI002DFD5C02|nr:hypothetical protein [Jatrophihabitans sp.]
MFAEQGALCAICAGAPAGHVDHDHAAAYLNRDPDVSSGAFVTDPRPADEPRVA